MNDFLHRLSNYFLWYEHNSFENSTSQTFNPEAIIDYDSDGHNITLHHNSTSDYFNRKTEKLPLLSEIFMDYIFIVKLAWGVMEFYLNICLKQSTYTVSPEKIYAWLVIYYSNLCSEIIFLIIIIFNLSISVDFEYFMCFVEIIIIAVEIYIVQSYYKQQKLAAVSDFVHLKWKYVPKPKIQSDKNRSSTSIVLENQLDETEDQSSYIPIFVKDLRRANNNS